MERCSTRIQRWLAQLQGYNFRVKYRKGALNVKADALSRIGYSLPKDQRLLEVKNSSSSEILVLNESKESLNIEDLDLPLSTLTPLDFPDSSSWIGHVVSLFHCIKVVVIK